LPLRVIAGSAVELQLWQEFRQRRRAVQRIDLATPVGAGDVAGPQLQRQIVDLLQPVADILCAGYAWIGAQQWRERAGAGEQADLGQEAAARCCRRRDRCGVRLGSHGLRDVGEGGRHAVPAAGHWRA
jgi:hypothetical protein